MFLCIYRLFEGVAAGSGDLEQLLIVSYTACCTVTVYSRGVGSAGSTVLQGMLTVSMPFLPLSVIVCRFFDTCLATNELTVSPALLYPNSILER